MKLTPQAAHNRAVWEAQSAEYQEKHRQDLEKAATARGIFSDAGLVVEDVPCEWARRWPGEVIWRLRN